MITEKQFSQQVVDLGHLYGWLIYRTWRSIHSPAGFPDLVMVRPPRLIFAELKSEKGKLTSVQEEWLARLGMLSACEVFLWRPDDFEDIVEVLKA